jgi:hypothetical protein
MIYIIFKHIDLHLPSVVVQYLRRDEMLPQVSVEIIFDFLHVNPVAVQQHPQNLMEHLHLNIIPIKKLIYTFIRIPYELPQEEGRYHLKPFI